MIPTFKKKYIIPLVVIALIIITFTIVQYRKFISEIEREFAWRNAQNNINYVSDLTTSISNSISNDVVPAGLIVRLNEEVSMGRVIYWFVVSREGRVINASKRVGTELARPYHDSLSIYHEVISVGQTRTSQEKHIVYIDDIIAPINSRYSLQIAFVSKMTDTNVPSELRGSLMLFLLPSIILISLLFGLLLLMFYLYGKTKRELIKTKRMAYLGEISGGLAHELKNPLNTVKMNVQLLEEDPELMNNLSFNKKITRIDRELERLSNYLSNFLRFARTPVMELSRFDLNDTINQVIRFFAPECISSGITLKSELHVGQLFIRADQKQIKQLLLNLLLNAKEASKKGTCILIKTEKKSGLVVITIKDQGSGISQENMKRIFEPFYTTKKSGTGIGMSVVKRIVEDHGGKLAVESKQDKGTTFIIMLNI